MDDRLAATLARLAVDLAWGTPGDTSWADRAIETAGRLLAEGYDTPATVELAALPRGSWTSDVEPVVRRLAAEHGLPFPSPEPDDAERLRFLLLGFAAGVVDVEDLYGPFYARVPAEHEQSALDRRLLGLLDEWEHAPDEGERARLVARMRAAVRAETS